jgi:hypothetical protein
MGRKSNIQRLKEALDYLKDGEGIFLRSKDQKGYLDDVFLVGELLDGSDKCYGFGKVNGVIQAVTRECSDGFPITDMDKDAITYIFNLSAPNIYKKILKRKYPTVPYDDI